MATTKKKPTVKPATVRKVAAKKTHKSPAKKKAAVAERSFQRSEEKTPFMTFEFTIQTVYWMVLSVIVLALGAWVMHLNVKIQNIYDQVEMNTQLSETYIVPMAEKSKLEATEPSM